jgi:pimeloyl-ACP methyl ester carboxylesterase
MRPPFLALAACSAIVLSACSSGYGTPSPRPDASAPTAPATRSADAGYTEHFIPYEGQRIYAREWPGAEPAIVLMHGFPDDLHLYDELIPFLGGRRVIAFDFLGWGASDKPAGRTYSADSQTRDVAAVLDYFRLQQVELVVHDASGPPGIDWALDHSDRVARLVLLNTYYSVMPTLRFPEAITIFSTPELRPIADSFTTNPALGRDLYEWQIGTFIQNDALRAKVVPKLFERFVPSVPAFRSLAASLPADLVVRTARVERLREFTRPVRIIFGAADTNLNPGVAASFHNIFPESDLQVIDGAGHYVQIDAARRVAGLLLD